MAVVANTVALLSPVSRSAAIGSVIDAPREATSQPIR
jgi:hypothetical protein